MLESTIHPIDLTAFGPTVYDGGAGAAGVELNTNTTTQPSLSDENKTFWDKALIVLAGPELVHDQFAQTRDIPRGSGKTIEFRQFDPLPEITAPLDEGVTPGGQELSVRAAHFTSAEDFLSQKDRGPLALFGGKLERGERDPAAQQVDPVARAYLAGSVGTAAEVLPVDDPVPLVARCGGHIAL